MDYYLTPSNSHLWFNCPYSSEELKSSNNTIDKYQHQSTIQSKQGTAAHSLARLKLLLEFNFINNTDYLNSKNEILKDLSNKIRNKIDKETDSYVEHIKNIIIEKGTIPKRGVEFMFDFSKILRRKCCGICDFVMFWPDELYIIDFKFGDGFTIEPEDNTQLMLYAAAFLTTKQNESKTIERIKLCIYQDFDFKIHEITKNELIDWINNDLKKSIDAVYNNHEKTNSGEWCNKFCPRRETCKEHIHSINNSIYKELSELTDEELFETFIKSQDIKKTIENLENFIRKRFEENKDINGLMMLTKTQTKITNPSAALSSVLEYSKLQNINIMNLVNLKCRSELEKVIDSEKLDELLSQFTEKVKCKGVIKQDTR